MAAFNAYLARVAATEISQPILLISVASPLIAYLSFSSLAQIIVGAIRSPMFLR